MYCYSFQHYKNKAHHSNLIELQSPVLILVQHFRNLSTLVLAGCVIEPTHCVDHFLYCNLSVTGAEKKKIVTKLLLLLLLLQQQQQQQQQEQKQEQQTQLIILLLLLLLLLLLYLLYMKQSDGKHIVASSKQTFRQIRYDSFGKSQPMHTFSQFS